MAKERPNFGSLLDTSTDDVERPKAMPEGSYLWTVKGMPRFDKSSKKQTEYAEFTLVCTAAGDDVDHEALDAYLTMKDGTKKGLSESIQRATYYLTEGSLFRLKDFLQHCGIELEGRSLRECIDDTPNCQVGAYIRHEASNDGESIFGRIGKTFSADSFNQADEAEAA